ncbi:MAG: AmmeMemoRadiSam system protein A [Ignavibacteria bacterium]|nr:AmmeMemoRadiSam system protein A [Ignavibacteria bacterium]
MLTSKEQQILVRIAFSAIVEHLAGSSRTQTELIGNLQQESGVFVTLRRDGDLRGCVGYVESERPIGRIVADLAVKAAFEDPRFPPLTIEEYPEIAVEISILSPLKELRSGDSLRIGTHGLVVESGSHRGVLLPHTALEMGWDPEAFKQAALKKADLAPDAMNSEATRFLSFTAEVIRSREVVTQ